MGIRYHTHTNSKSAALPRQKGSGQHSAVCMWRVMSIRLQATCEPDGSLTTTIGHGFLHTLSIGSYNVARGIAPLPAAIYGRLTDSNVDT